MGYIIGTVAVRSQKWEPQRIDSIPQGFGVLFVPILRNDSKVSPTPQAQVLWTKDRPGVNVTDGGPYDSYVVGNGGVFAVYEPGTYYIYQADSVTIVWEYRFLPLAMIAELLPSGGLRTLKTIFTIGPTVSAIIALGRPLRKSLSVALWFGGPNQVWVQENSDVWTASEPNSSNAIGVGTKYLFAGDENMTGIVYCKNMDLANTAKVIVVDKYNE